jgi:hypothetical protein
MDAQIVWAAIRENLAAPYTSAINRFLRRNTVFHNRSMTRSKKSVQAPSDHSSTYRCDVPRREGTRLREIQHRFVIASRNSAKADH